MSRIATPTDNPIIESKNGWLKKEMYIDFNQEDYDKLEIALSLLNLIVVILQRRPKRRVTQTNDLSFFNAHFSIILTYINCLYKIISKN